MWRGGTISGGPRKSQKMLISFGIPCFSDILGIPSGSGLVGRRGYTFDGYSSTPSHDCKKQAFSENVALAAGIINILASQTREIHALLTRAIAFWETAYRRIAGTFRSRDSIFDRFLSSGCNSPPLGTLGIRNHPYTRRPVPREVSRPSGKFWHQRWWS